jgi:hypothetical protein
MKSSQAKVFLFLVVVMSSSLVAYSGTLKGKVGSSSQWGSGWIDLVPVVDLRQGDKLKLTIGGTAKRIVVRLLAMGEDPSDPVGIVDTDVPVPQDRVVTVTLKEEHPRTVQISVHGGPNPWNKYSLGGGNGAATLQKAERLAP